MACSAAAKSPVWRAAFKISPAWLRTKTESRDEESRMRRAAPRSTAAGSSANSKRLWQTIRSNDAGGKIPSRRAASPSLRVMLTLRPASSTVRCARASIAVDESSRVTWIPRRARRAAVAPVPQPRSRARSELRSRHEGRSSCRLAKTRSARRRPMGVSRYAAYRLASVSKQFSLLAVAFMRPQRNCPNLKEWPFKNTLKSECTEGRKRKWAYLWVWLCAAGEGGMKLSLHRRAEAEGAESLKLAQAGVPVPQKRNTSGLFF